jgi:hypothetical protein
VGTWIMLLLFGLVVAGFILVRNKNEAALTEPTPTSETYALFDGITGTPTSIEITLAGGDAVRMVRDSSNAWMMELPEVAAANPGIAEQAAAQVTALRVLSELDGNDPATYGLDEPAYVIKVKFDGGEEHILEVGDRTISDAGYYARLDKGGIVIIDPNGIDALTNLVLFPPYLNTPTPSPVPATSTLPPLPSETPTPTP